MVLCLEYYSVLQNCVFSVKVKLLCLLVLLGKWQKHQVSESVAVSVTIRPHIKLVIILSAGGDWLWEAFFKILLGMA